MQAILQLAQGIDDVFKSTGAFAFSDFYQAHFYLPENRILMLTNQRVLMLLVSDSGRHSTWIYHEKVSCFRAYSFLSI